MDKSQGTEKKSETKEPKKMGKKQSKGKALKLKDFDEFVKIFDRIFVVLQKYQETIVTFTEEVAKQIRLRFHGKTIAVIGPVAVGKTTMLHVLKDPTKNIDPMIYEKTTDPVSFSDKMILEWKLPLDDPKEKRRGNKIKG